MNKAKRKLIAIQKYASTKSLSLAVYLMTLALFSPAPSFAGLQTAYTPAGVTDDGNFFTLLRSYFSDAVNLVVLGLGAVSLIFVIKNGLAVYHEIGEGKKKWGDLAGHLVGGVLIVIVAAYFGSRALTAMQPAA